MGDKPVEPMVVLGVSESWGLLREAVVGRLAVVVGDQPEIFPVNYLVDHGSIVFRTAEGTKLANSIGRPVAFEVDGYDAASGEAWSVVVKGKAWEVKRLHEVLDALDLPLFPWHAAPKRHIVRIEPETVSGRRFHVLDAPARHMPQQQPRRASYE
jgi:nitroimidazol reductase NimA-like FMN-containing flavoprotein (pyridoxamine 5'-phosphate oxidase superfamily)